MNSLHPILIGLVDRLGWQPVDQEIFGGAAVLDAVAKIDLQPADPGDALDPGEFGFALLQRAIGPVALVGDLLQVLPQLLRGGGFGKDSWRGIPAGHLPLHSLMWSVTQPARHGYRYRRTGLAEP